MGNAAGYKLRGTSPQAALLVTVAKELAGNTSQGIRRSR